MNNMYEIRFDTYKSGRAVLYALHVEAPNKRVAKRMAEDLWYKEKEDPRHMFHMTVERIPETGEFLWHWFHSMETRWYKGNQTPYMNCPGYDSHHTVTKVKELTYCDPGCRGGSRTTTYVYYSDGREEQYRSDKDACLPIGAVLFMTAETGSCKTIYVGKAKVTEYTI